MKLLKWLTSIAAIYLIIGISLIVAGQMHFLSYLIPNWFSENSPVHSVVKTIGAALVGSGVFTSMIKSSAYAKIFSNILGEIVWSKKYVEQTSTTEKMRIWRTVSKVLYEEKFPKISDDIEDIITSHYFPTSHNFYLEGHSLIINICDHPDNKDFWIQKETIEFTLVPNSDENEIIYKTTGNIDLPPFAINKKNEAGNGNDLDSQALSRSVITQKGTLTTSKELSNDEKQVNHSQQDELNEQLNSTAENMLQAENNVTLVDEFTDHTAFQTLAEKALTDLTDFNTYEILVNGESRLDAQKKPYKEDAQMIQSLELRLVKSAEYKVVIRREKCVYKKTNPDKRFFANSIIKGLKVTVISDINLDCHLHKMGTIKSYSPGYAEIHGSVKITSWHYDGVILPHQGYIVIFK